MNHHWVTVWTADLSFTSAAGSFMWISRQESEAVGSSEKLPHSTLCSFTVTSRHMWTVAHFSQSCLCESQQMIRRKDAITVQTLNRNIASAGEELQPFHTVISSLYKQIKSLGDDFNCGICIWNLLLKKSNGSALGYKNKTNLERGSESSVHSDKKKKREECTGEVWQKKADDEQFWKKIQEESLL